MILRVCYETQVKDVIMPRNVDDIINSLSPRAGKKSRGPRGTSESRVSGPLTRHTVRHRGNGCKATVSQAPRRLNFFQGPLTAATLDETALSTSTWRTLIVSPIARSITRT